MLEKVDSFICSLSIGGGATIPLVSVDMTVTVFGLNKASVTLPVGNWEINNLPNDITLKRGASASILISYPGLTGSTTIFSGVLFDFSPSASVKGHEGQLAMEVTLYGRLYHLTTGTLHSSQTAPASYLDANNYWSTASTTVGAQKRAARVEETKANANFGTAFIDSLREIANGSYSPSDSVSDFIKGKFGTDVNAPALDVLDDIDPRLVFRNFAARKLVIDGIVGRINASTTGDWGMRSFKQRIDDLGTLMYFSLLEVGKNIYMVPWSPFFTSGSALVITPDTYHSIAAVQASAKEGTALNYQGTVLTSSVGNAQKTTPVAGYYKAPRTSGGRVLVLPMPWIYVRTAVDTTVDVVAKPRTSLDISQGLANNIAKYKYWEARYGTRTYSVSCPYLRLDVGPLTPVRIQTPRSNEVQSALGTATIYGMVTAVTIRLDATQGVAETILEVGYARNAPDQEQLVEPEASSHPLWSQNWRGSTLSGNPR
jgi:hypothetical protein